MKYYTNIRRGEILIEDAEGEECDSPLAALDLAMRAAREIMAERLRAGLPLGDEIVEIYDGQGVLVRRFPFSDAIPTTELYA